MGSARDDILAKLGGPARNDAPVRPPFVPAHKSGVSLHSEFETRVCVAASTVDHVAETNQVGAAIARYLRDQNLPARVNLGPDIEAMRPAIEASVDVSDADLHADGLALVTGCLAAVSETGTIVLASGPTVDTRLGYLAETHIVLLEAHHLVQSYENAWNLLDGRVPRAVNFVTGPSRTADIEQTIERGAHGPRRLHVVIIGENA